MPEPSHHDALAAGPDGIVVTDDAGVVTYVNAAAAHIAAIDARAARGQVLDEVLPLRDADGASWWSCTQPFGGLTTRTRQPERLVWLPDGAQVFVTAAYIRAGGPGTALTQLVVGLRPATERMRIERRGAELVAVAAHELRSPLTSIKGFTGTLLAKWDRFTDDQRRLLLETVDADAHRLTRLIGDLLDVARIDAGQLVLRPMWVDVASHARQAIARLVGSGEQAERFVLAVGADVPEVWADPDKVDQVLSNLLENAVRHGSGTITMAVDPNTEVADNEVADNEVADGAARGHGVVVAVSDEGAGVPEHLAARTFQKFWRTGNGGTGLGLYVVRGIVDAHGGSIGVDRADGGGARFRFRLPVGAPDVPA